jgi:hypothetical protein
MHSSFSILDSISTEGEAKTILPKEDLAEIIYSQIITLGYNNQDINSSLNDLMQTRNPLICTGPEETGAVNIANHLSVICHDYFHQV